MGLRRLRIDHRRVPRAAAAVGVRVHEQLRSRHVVQPIEPLSPSVLGSSFSAFLLLGLLQLALLDLLLKSTELGFIKLRFWYVHVLTIRGQLSNKSIINPFTGEEYSPHVYCNAEGLNRGTVQALRGSLFVPTKHELKVWASSN